MKLLFVGDAYDVHSARWISQLSETGWEIHLFDPLNRLIHPDLRQTHVHTGWKKPSVPPTTRVSYRWPFLRGRHAIERELPALWRRIVPEPGQRLAHLIRRQRPDCIHSFGLQHHSEAVLQALDLLPGHLGIPWIYSCRGSDIYYFQSDPQQLTNIRRVLESCDFYMCNCERDVRLARRHGFRGELLGLFQGGGGFPIQEMRDLRSPLPPSERRTLAIKGLETQFGRGLLTLEALRLCARHLSPFRLVVYQAQPEVELAAREMAASTGLHVEVIPRTSPQEIWKLFGSSRLSIGISRSDGVPNTMLESMIMGAFPIQTDPGGASGEWIEDGDNGLLVPPDDPEKIAAAISRSLQDDDAVDRAAELNRLLTSERLDREVVRQQAIAAYRHVVETPQLG